MAKTETKRGRPRQYGRRVNFTFRIHADVKERLAAKAAQAGRSLSEEAEFRLNRDISSGDDLEQRQAQIETRLSAANITALRLAALMVLRESEGKPVRVVMDLETLLAEADGLLRGMRGGFTDDEASAESEPLWRTHDQEQKLLAEIEELRRKLKAALAKADKPAKANEAA